MLSWPIIEIWSVNVHFSLIVNMIFVLCAFIIAKEQII